MEIIVAKTCGFCFGSKRSVAMASEAGKAYSLGSLLHNEILIENLREKGIEPREYNDILKEKPCKVVIRAHGVPIQQINELERRGFEIIDTTCTKIQDIYDITVQHEKMGYKVVVLGEKGHPEVVGIVSRLNDPAVVKTANEIQNKYMKICVVSQTTQRTDTYEQLLDELEQKCPDLKAFNTICDATKERQNSASSLAKIVDKMIIIGGKTSSNTKRLLEICRQQNNQSYLIQSRADLQKHWFDNAQKIGITAGASTPDFVTDSVVEELKLYKD